MLTAGRPAPAEGDIIRRGEGVALVLRGLAITAWKRGGKWWTAWSSRCVSAYLDFSGTTGGLHVISC